MESATLFLVFVYSKRSAFFDADFHVMFVCLRYCLQFSYGSVSLRTSSHVPCYILHDVAGALLFDLFRALEPELVRLWKSLPQFVGDLEWARMGAEPVHHFASLALHSSADFSGRALLQRAGLRKTSGARRRVVELCALQREGALVVAAVRSDNRPSPPSGFRQARESAFRSAWSGASGVG